MNMRFKGKITLPILFLKKGMIEIDGDDFNEDNYDVDKVEIFSIDYMYETFYDEDKTIFKYTVIGVGGDSFCTTVRKREVMDRIKLSKDYE